MKEFIGTMFSQVLLLILLVCCCCMCVCVCVCVCVCDKDERMKKMEKTDDKRNRETQVDYYFCVGR